MVGVSVVTEQELTEVGGPPIPLGRRVVLPGRGTTFVREIDGPPGAPTVLLLHGLVASGGLNWFQAFAPLAEHFRVVAIDHRGHGRGIRSWRRFRLSDCADDAAAVLDELGIDEAIAVGYSMGGPIAQLLWHRHPEKVSGLVLCATSNRFVPGVRERMAFVTAVAAISGTTRIGQFLGGLPVRPVVRRIARSRGTTMKVRPDNLRRWAAAEMRRHDARMVTEALAATTNFDSSKWLHAVEVPTSIIVTREDKAIPPQEQLRMLVAIPHAEVTMIDDGHVWCAKPEFGPAITRACRTVAGV